MSSHEVSGFQWALSAANVVLQFANVATDSLCGLSGQDSIVRASVTSLDSSAGLLFLWATLNFIYPPGRNSRFCLSRWALLHPTPADSSRRLKLSMRSSWLQITSTTKRVARIKVLQVSQIRGALCSRSELRVIIGTKYWCSAGNG